MTDAELRNMVSKTLTCRIDKRLAIAAPEISGFSLKTDSFLGACQYNSLCSYSVGEGFVNITNFEYYVIVPSGFQGKLW